MKRITFENYHRFTGKKVEVEITCYEGGMMYPDDNVLIGMNEEYFYFYSIEDECYWHWSAKDDTGPKHEKLNCSIRVYQKLEVPTVLNFDYGKANKNN